MRLLFGSDSVWLTFFVLPFFYGMEAKYGVLMIVCGSPEADTLTERLETMISLFFFLLSLSFPLHDFQVDRYIVFSSYIF